jgi:CubicO group peptidase (beta-lactamase class C family)
VSLRFVKGVLAEHMGTHGLPGGVAVVITEGKVAGTVCLGTTDRHNAERVTADQVVALGSASKALAVVGVLQLVADGAVALDGLVAEHVDSNVLALAGNPMTVRQLLSQRSSGGVAQVRRNRPWSAARASIVPRGAPSWTVDLGRIAELISNVSGEPFDVYMAKHVFAPLDMWAGAFSRLRLVLPEAPSRRQRPSISATRRPVVTGAQCTPLEFGRFLAALAGDGSGAEGTLLEPAMVARMATPAAPPPASGLGVWVEPGRTAPIALVGSNTGAVAGAYAPGTGVAVAIAFRPDRGFQPGNTGPARLARELVEDLLCGPSPLIPEGPPPPFPWAS